MRVFKKDITEIGLLLPIPDALRGPLKEADTRRSGFLMKDLKKIAGEKTAAFHFETEVPIWIREQIHSDLPDYYFSVLGKFNAGGAITIKKIRVSEAEGDLPVQLADELQMLDVMAKMEPVDRDSVNLFVEDLNFDGYKDLGLQTHEIEENAYNDYWLFNPETGSFEYLGNYPTLLPDPEKQELIVSEPTAEKVYRIQDGK